MATYTAQVKKLFKSPGPLPNGLQAAPDGLWCIDQETNKVHKMEWTTGEVLLEFDTDTEHSSGITLDEDGYVWVASTWQLQLVKYDPVDGRMLARYPDPGIGLTVVAEKEGKGRKSSSHGLEWKEGKIYAASPATQRVHVVDVATWQEILSFPTGGLRVHGIGWSNDGRLWVSDTSAGTIHLMDPESGRISKVFRVAEPVEVHGLTVRDDEFWYCDASTQDIGILVMQF